MAGALISSLRFRDPTMQEEKATHQDMAHLRGCWLGTGCSEAPKSENTGVTDCASDTAKGDRVQHREEGT